MYNNPGFQLFLMVPRPRHGAPCADKVREDLFEAYSADTVTSQFTTFADRPPLSRAIAAADVLIQCAFLSRVKCHDPFPPFFARLSSIPDLSVPTLCPSANKRTQGQPASRHSRGPVGQTSRRLQGCRGSS